MSRDRFFTVRRSSPGEHAGFFPTGQGGRPVLPPLSDSLRFPVPVPYTQPRSAPNRLSYDLDPQALYPDYSNSSSSPQFPSAFPNYEIQRYSPQPSYPPYPRPTPPPPPQDSRRLPPLSTTPPPDRWPHQQHFVPQPPFPPANNNIRSPMATYPNQFLQQYPHPHQSNVYQYPMPQPDPRLFDIENRSNSPFNPPHDRQPSPPPLSPTSPDEPTVKKKRRRADANQLKVLNETYARTAFPSTEERIALAKMLDMSARSVQIWFQNKRQAMRQTNRQTNSLSSQAQQPYSLADSMSDQLIAHPAPGSAYDPSLNDSLYLPSSSPEASRHSHAHHSHGHSHDLSHSHPHPHEHSLGHSHHAHQHSAHSSRHRD